MQKTFFKGVFCSLKNLADCSARHKVLAGSQGVEGSQHPNRSFKNWLTDIVTFIDFSEDGYTRQNRRKSTQEVNLRNTDHADERYEEVTAIVLGKKKKTDYYNEENGKVIKDTISLNGDDWNLSQHRVINTTPTLDDFRKTVSDYLSFKVSQLMKEAV